MRYTWSEEEGRTVGNAGDGDLKVPIRFFERAEQILLLPVGEELLEGDEFRRSAGSGVVLGRFVATRRGSVAASCAHPAPAPAPASPAGVLPQRRDRLFTERSHFHERALTLIPSCALLFFATPLAWPCSPLFPVQQCKDRRR